MWKSLGFVLVPVPGTLVCATINIAAFGVRVGAHAVLFQQRKGQAGYCYVFDDPAGNKGTGAHLLASLAVPTSNTCPSASVTITYSPVGLNAAMYWIDADNAGEGLQVSIIQA